MHGYNYTAMHNFTQHAILLLKRFLCLLILYTFSRIIFFLLNYQYFSGISFTSLLIVFIAGIRFDIAAILFTNFFLLLFILPGDYKNRRIVIHGSEVLFYSINALALLSNFIDAKFFDFTNKRSTTAVFSLLHPEDDVWQLILRFIVDYWYVGLLWIIVMFLFWKWMPRLKKEKLVLEPLSAKNFVYQLLFILGIVLFILAGARGIKLKPISMVDAASYTELKNAPIVLNTPFSLIKTIENKNLEELSYFPTDSVNYYFNPVHQYTGKNPFLKRNVVVFILESFSKEYCGFLGGEPGHTPCLDSLFAHSRVYANAFANGTQSYEAMPAIIAGIPSLMDRPYSGSNYADNYIESLPSLLRKEGYQTSFYHGGNNGTMGFNNFAHVAGIAKYKGRTEYKHDADYDGYWGIWDEPYLRYFARQLESSKQPFFSAVFTLSSHHPYNVPEKYKERFKEGKLPILKSIEYADYALGAFFRMACKMPWYNNTLFVFTADHAAQAVEKTYNSTTGMFAIPLALYCASDTGLIGTDSTICQQIDLMPTVLDYLGYRKPYFAFGESLLDSSAAHKAITYVNGIYQLVEGNYVLQFDGKQVMAFYNRLEEKEGTTIGSVPMKYDPDTDKIYAHMLSTIKAILQTYNNSLIHNTLTLTTRSK